MKIENSFHFLKPISWLPVTAFIMLSSCIYFWNLSTVPFHPDESTQIYMSSDIEQIFTDPSLLFWNPDPIDPVRQSYRLLDAPIMRYLIGISRQLFKVEPLESDWSWSSSWEQNVQNKAYPNSKQLWVSRLASAVFFPFSLLLLYKLGKRISSSKLGWILMLLFSINPLVLLHTRRAMSEGPLVFFILLFLWTIVNRKRNVYLIASSLALAINSKYSAAPLLIVGGLFLFFDAKDKENKWKIPLKNVVIFTTVIIAVTIMLNPFSWSNPIDSIQAAFRARQNLVANQVADLRIIAPERVLDTLSERSAAIVGNLFFTRLAFADYGNYSKYTSESEMYYLEYPVNNLFRTPLGGAFFVTLTLLGLTISIVQWKKDHFRVDQPLFPINLSAFAEISFLLISVPLPYQRYIIPLLPFILIWVGVALEHLLSLIQTKNKKEPGIK